MAQRAPQDVLSECLEHWEEGDGRVDEVLAQHPALRDDLEPLLTLAADLRAMPPLRAPARLREDPLWRRAPSRTAHPTPSEQRRRPVPLWAAVHRERAGRPIGPRWPRQAVVSGLGRLAQARRLAARAPGHQSHGRSSKTQLPLSGAR